MVEFRHTLVGIRRNVKPQIHNQYIYTRICFRDGSLYTDNLLDKKLRQESQNKLSEDLGGGMFVLKTFSSLNYTSPATIEEVR